MQGMRPRVVALGLELVTWLAAGVAFLIWGTIRYRGLTYCPFDSPTVGHPYLVGAVIATSAAIVAGVTESTVARRRWQTAAAIGAVMFVLTFAALYVVAVFIGGGHRCFD